MAAALCAVWVGCRGVGNGSVVVTWQYACVDDGGVAVTWCTV